MLLDYQLGLLQEALALFDEHLDRLEAAANSSPDPDQEGVFDSMDYVAGMGFAACQQYVVSIHSQLQMSRLKALQCPPLHRTGHAIAAVVNAAANHWKHSSEWGDPPSHRAGQTLEVLRDLGVQVSGNYVMVNVLHHLLSPLRARFGNLVPFLTGWRDEVFRAM